MNDYTLPTTLDFMPTFKAVFREVADNMQDLNYSFSYAADAEQIRADYLTAFGGDEVEAKEAFDMDLSNAIAETCSLLGVGEAAGAETGDWLGELYDAVEELGFYWPEND
jgi:hypothetical protein